MKTKRPGIPLPTKWGYLLTVETQRQFRFLERLKLLLGYSTKTVFQIQMEHSCGKFEAYPVTVVSKELLPRFSGDVEQVAIR